MFYGIIKKTTERGFGFIGQEGGPDVYFHATQLPEGEFARLQPDQPVKFELAKRDRDEKPTERKGPKAAKVVLIARMPGGIMQTKELTPPPHRRAKFRKAKWKRRIDVQSKSTDELPASETLTGEPPGNQP
jgi:cold shock CspA family protein